MILRDRLVTGPGCCWRAGRGSAGRAGGWGGAGPAPGVRADAGEAGARSQAPEGERTRRGLGSTEAVAKREFEGN